MQVRDGWGSMAVMASMLIMFAVGIVALGISLMTDADHTTITLAVLLIFMPLLGCLVVLIEDRSRNKLP